MEISSVLMELLVVFGVCLLRSDGFLFFDVGLWLNSIKQMLLAAHVCK